MHELGNISAWLGTHFDDFIHTNDAEYLDSKHHLEAAREANKYL